MKQTQWTEGMMAVSEAGEAATVEVEWKWRSDDGVGWGVKKKVELKKLLKEQEAALVQEKKLALAEVEKEKANAKKDLKWKEQVWTARKRDLLTEL